MTTDNKISKENQYDEVNKNDNPTIGINLKENDDTQINNLSYNKLHTISNDTTINVISPSIDNINNNIEWRKSIQCELPSKLDNNRISDSENNENKRISSSVPAAIWSKMGTLSERASEIFEDATNQAKNKNTNKLKNKVKLISKDYNKENVINEDDNNKEHTPKLNNYRNDEEILTPESPIVSSTYTTQSSATSGVGGVTASKDSYYAGSLSKRSEWLRRWEKGYYVIHRITLKKYSSKDVYLANENNNSFNTDTPRKKGSTPTSSHNDGSIHTYTVTGVRESTTKQYSFVIQILEGKPLLVAASSAVEKLVWMRIILESLVALPDTILTPPDVEEFYAALIVLYTAHTGDWRTGTDMGVTLPPPSEQVFSRLFSFISRDITLTSNYPPSVPFCGSYHGHDGFLRYISIFSSHTKWSNFRIEGTTFDGTIAVASGREELENRKDSRKFTQNWIHKFSFNNNGNLLKMEINADVVAASAVFKVPGAATTLKLPSELQEIDPEVGKMGKVIVRILQGNGLKFGANHKKHVKEPYINVSLEYGTNPPTLHTINTNSGSGSTIVASIPVQKLARKLSSKAMRSSSTNSLKDDDTLNYQSSSGTEHQSSGPPKNQPTDTSASNTNPIWESVVSLMYENVQGACWLVVEVFDRSKGNHPFGGASINLSKYIMDSYFQSNYGINGLKSPHTKAIQQVKPPKWYTLSNSKGEYCGKILLDILCENRSFSKSRSTMSKTTISPPRKTSSYNLDDKRRNNFTMFMVSSTDKEDINIKHNDDNIEENNWSNITNVSPNSGKNKPRSADSTKKFGNNKFVRQNTYDISSINNVSAASGGILAQNDSRKSSLYLRKGSTTKGITADLDGVHTFSVCGAPFVVPKRYNLIKVCGRGAYGIVIAATNVITGGNVAIKKVIDCIWHSHQLKQVLREVKLMRHLAHENILSLMDLIPPPSYQDFRDVYMTVDLMEMDLHRIIYSKEILSDDHIRYFLYQLLSGLRHMHKAGVLHRDLKPSNLLINSDCQLKICDLGLARSKDIIDAGMTEYVVTRWYRAPELLLGSAYGEGVDVWAAGCIFAEMLGRKPLFPGRSYVHQLQLILNVLGVPEEHSFKENPQAQKLKGRQLLSRTPSMQGMDLSALFPNANPEALNLLWKMLEFDSDKRISVDDALHHPYLISLYDNEKDGRYVDKFDFDIDDVNDEDLKELMFREICHFHPEEMEKRARQLAAIPEDERLPPGWVKRESRSVKGKFYYSNPKKGISTWVKPIE